MTAASFDSDYDGDIEHGLSPDTTDSDEEDSPAPRSMGGAFRFVNVERARDNGLSAIGAWVCRAPGAAHDRSLETARRRLVTLAAGARARGIALEYASAAAGEQGRRWLAHRFYGYPWPMAVVDEATAALLNELAAEARSIQSAEIPSASPSAFHGVSPPDHCVAEPLLGARSLAN